MNNNIFLTGPRDVGKSTIIEGVLDSFTGTVGGFNTRLQLLNDGSRAFIMDSFNLEPAPNCKPYICKLGPSGRLEPISKTFDGFGTRILDDCLQKKVEIIVMDELGIFESEARYFQDKVKLCLSSRIPVLGVIKAKENSFLNEISNRLDVQVVEVTLENRDQIKLEIENIINNY